jgi:very-short-patch-repair endonuclease
MSRGGDDGRAADGRSRILPLTPAQQVRLAALGPRERFRDAEFQRWAQSHRSPQSLAAAGKLGWAATVRRYGSDFAFDRAAQTRRERPSAPERAMIALLASLGQRQGEDYRREHKVAPRTYVDFAWPDRRAIEVYGAVHFGRFDPDGTRAAYDAAREARIRELGWSLVVVTANDLRPAQREATRARVGAFLRPEEGRLVSVSRQAMERLRTLWRR